MESRGPSLTVVVLFQGEGEDSSDFELGGIESKGYPAASERFFADLHFSHFVNNRHMLPSRE
jgi:hypothetical protein